MAACSGAGTAIRKRAAIISDGHEALAWQRDSLLQVFPIVNFEHEDQ
jgi:hypothetical protein